MRQIAATDADNKSFFMTKVSYREEQLQSESVAMTYNLCSCIVPIIDSKRSFLNRFTRSIQTFPALIQTVST